MVTVSGADLAPYERLIRSSMTARLAAPDAAVGVEDVRAELRIAAWIAIRHYREHHDGGPEDERRYTYRAVRNRAADLARRNARRPDHTPAEPDLHGKSEAVPWYTMIQARTPEDDAADADDRRVALETLARIREVIGDQDYRQLADWHDPDRAPLSKSAGNALECRARRARARVRRIYPDRSSIPIRRVKMPFPASDLLDDSHLARVLLIHGRPIKSLDREHLVSLVDDLNQGVHFPACFATGARGDAEPEYDDQDDTCRGCGFFVECGACVGGKWTRSDIEDQLVELQTLHNAPEPEPEADPEPDPEPKKKAPKKKAPKKTAAKKTAPKKKAPKKKAPRRAPVTLAEKQTLRAEGDIRYAPLSTRRGVLPSGQTTFKGVRRIPQGSAVAAAALPPGTEVGRLWPVRSDDARYWYTARKIEDGRTGERYDGRRRKRDGVWEIIAVYSEDQVQHVDGKYQLREGATALKSHPLLAYSGSLNQIARKITGAGSWSGARFFGLTAAAVAKIAPEVQADLAAAPASMYEYSV